MADKTTDKHRLKVIRKIGQGAYGEVFKGSYDGQSCALKVPSGDPGTPGEATNVQMMRNEASVLSKCQHSRIIGYKALCTLTPHKRAACGRWALVLEYANGGSLSDKVSAQMISPSRKVYSNAQALGWALDLGTALEYLHQRTPMIVHRDVKLSNVVLMDEAGSLVAKLADLGLHMEVDDSKNRLLRASSISNGSTAAAAAAMAAAGQPLLVELGPVGMDELPGGRSSSVTPKVGAAPVACSKGGTGMRTAEQQQQQEADTPPAGAAAAGRGPARRVSFIDSPPSGEGPRSSSVAYATASSTASPLAESDEAALVASIYPAVAAFAAAGTQSGADCYAGRVTHQPLYRARSEFGESMVTDATWLSEGGDLSAAASMTTCSSMCGWESSMDSSTWEAEFETVFHMTGQTGSCMTMAPEVFLGHPYNEKADVFSFGVVLYELAARCLLIFTELPTHTTDPAITEWYAAKVAEGYRPKKPKQMSPQLWQLIEACWHQEPCARPSMSKVVELLQGLLAEELAASNSKKAARQRSRAAAPAAAAGPAGAGPAAAACSSTAHPPAPSGGCCVIS